MEAEEGTGDVGDETGAEGVEPKDLSTWESEAINVSSRSPVSPGKGEGVGSGKGACWGEASRPSFEWSKTITFKEVAYMDTKSNHEPEIQQFKSSTIWAQTALQNLQMGSLPQYTF